MKSKNGSEIRTRRDEIVLLIPDGIHGNQREKLLRKAAKERSICTRCYKDGVRSGASTCDNCLLLRRQDMKRKFDDRVASGLCSNCGIGKPVARATYCHKCKDKLSLRLRVKYDTLKGMVFDHYGNKCSCCGENERRFLQVDHVNDDGAEHRRAIGHDKIYRI